MLEVNRIHLGDCLDLMGDIENGSIDMILADLPYGTTACHWDSIIPLEPLWAHYKRVIKPRGAIVLTASQPFTSVLVMSNLEWFKYEWMLRKNQGSNFAGLKYAPFKEHESALVFSLGIGVFNPQKTKVANSSLKRDKVGSVRALKATGEATHNGVKRVDIVLRQDGYRHPSSVIEYKLPRGAEKVKHPTQKPVSLFSYLIRTYTNLGALVLDNVMGSGTTAIAAIETGRNWIGIEKDEGYYKIATERIEKRLRQPLLPGITEPPRKPATQGNLLDDLA